MQKETGLLLDVVRYLLNNRIVEFPQVEESLEWEYVLRLSMKHNISNLVCYVMEQFPQGEGPSETIRDEVYEIMRREMLRSYRQIDETEAVIGAFEKIGIKSLAVKGICTKRYYPEPDMRTMGDVDLLYYASEEKKVQHIMEELGYECKMEGRKHDLYKKKPYVGMELHRELVASESKYSEYYENIWEKAKLKEGCKYTYEFTLEDEYIYTIIHLVEHFINGGIGIRFIMDVYVYSQLQEMNWAYIQKELETLELWAFHEKLAKLARVWFAVEKEEADEITEELATYIVDSGVFGTAERHAAVSVAKEGRFKFLWKTIFPGLKSMQSMFSWLRKWPILLPYAWVLRGVRSICHRRKNVKEQFHKYKHGDEQLGEKLQQFYEKCGL